MSEEDTREELVKFRKGCDGRFNHGFITVTQEVYKGLKSSY